jgi:hypothetical protein
MSTTSNYPENNTNQNNLGTIPSTFNGTNNNNQFNNIPIPVPNSS